MLSTTPNEISFPICSKCRKKGWVLSIQIHSQSYGVAQDYFPRSRWTWPWATSQKAHGECAFPWQETIEGICGSSKLQNSHIYTHIYMYKIYIYIYLYTSTYICIYIYTCIFKYIHIYILIDLYVYYIYIFMVVYTHSCHPKININHYVHGYAAT